MLYLCIILIWRVFIPVEIGIATLELLPQSNLSTGFYLLDFIVWILRAWKFLLCLRPVCWTAGNVCRSLRNAVFWLTRSLHECIFSSWNSALLVTLHLLLHWFTKFRPLPLSALHVQLAKSVVRPCSWQERRRWKKMSMCDVCGVWVYTLVRFWGIDVLLGISRSFQTKNCWPLDGGSMHLCNFMRRSSTAI